MKGYLFSTEALITLVVIILASSLFWYTSSLAQKETNTLQIQNQTDRAMTLYFNLPEKIAGTNTITQYCEKTIDYNSPSKALLEKKTCRWEK